MSTVVTPTRSIGTTATLVHAAPSTNFRDMLVSLSICNKHASANVVVQCFFRQSGPLDTYFAANISVPYGETINALNALGKLGVLPGMDVYVQSDTASSVDVIVTADRARNT